LIAGRCSPTRGNSSSFRLLSGLELAQWGCTRRPPPCRDSHPQPSRAPHAMILCVTLNPCLDKTLTVPACRPGDSVSGRRTSEVVGGKGNNVARALKRLGRDARPATFLGGPVGQLCEGLLRSADGLDPLVTPTAAPTRTILTVRTDDSAEQTAF